MLEKTEQNYDYRSHLEVYCCIYKIISKQLSKTVGCRENSQILVIYRFRGLLMDLHKNGQAIHHQYDTDRS